MPTDPSGASAAGSLEPHRERARKVAAEAVTNDLLDLLRIKERLPFLESVNAEFSRLPVGAPLRNDIVLRLIHDTSDMLVIDLASLRDRVVHQSQGTLTAVAEIAVTLRKFRPEDLPSALIASQRGSKELDLDDRTSRANDLNGVFERLFPGQTTASRRAVHDLRSRIKSATQVIEDDRNQARAHRYDSTHAQAAPKSVAVIKQHIEILEQYLNDLSILMTRGSVTTQPSTLASPEKTATDLVDLIVFGDFAGAIDDVGGRLVDKSGAAAWYWRLRADWMGRSSSAPSGGASV